MSTLNDFQSTASRVYGGGDFYGITYIEESQNVGDGLFGFIITELSTHEDCRDKETALQRLKSAQAELQVVIDAIETLPDETVKSER